MRFFSHWTLIGTLLGIATFGQEGGGTPAPAPAPAPGGTPGGTNPGNPGSPGSPMPGGGRIPNQNIPNNQDRFPNFERQMPVFLSGKVMTQDGTPPPEPATIERVCNGASPRPEGYTDSKGRFSFQLGNNMGMMQDASVSNSADMSDMTGRNSGGGFPGMGGGQRGISERDLMGCEIRASLPGYRSSVVTLAGRRFLDNPDIGTIILKRLGNVEGVTASITTLEAPKEAKKSYEKALNSLKKNKLEDAERELTKAVELYPRYAIAWQELGGVHERAQKNTEARQAYAKALEADAKLVRPYLQLAGIAMREQKWDEAVASTERVIKLNPYDFAGAYFFNAVANLQLQNLDAAERSAREGIKQDEFHRVPKLEHVLGVVLAQKNDLKGAAEHMTTYLKLSPNGKDAEFVRNQLADISKINAEASSASAAPVAGPKP